MDLYDVYQNYYRHIFNYALKLICHPENALDITQDAFLKVMQRLDTLKDGQTSASWLRTICFHEFVNRTKRDLRKYLTEPVEWGKLERRGVLLINVAPQPEDEVIVKEEIRSLQNGCFLVMVKKLALHQCIAFSLVNMYELPIEHIAGISDIPEGAARGLLYRTRINIGSSFADHCGVIYEKSPCSCKAQIVFSLNRPDLQGKVKKLTDRLDFEQKNYTCDKSVRRRAMYLYRHMPEQKPPDE